jgi:hypothetical protein
MENFWFWSILHMTNSAYLQYPDTVTKYLGNTNRFFNL